MSRKSGYDKLMAAKRDIADLKSHHHPLWANNIRMKEEGVELFRKRMRCGLTQKDLAEALECSITTIVSIESGVREILDDEREVLDRILTSEAEKKHFVEHILAETVRFMDETWSSLKWEEGDDCDYVVMYSDTDSTMNENVKEINKEAHIDDIAARIVDSVHECKIWAR